MSIRPTSEYPHPRIIPQVAGAQYTFCIGWPMSANVYLSKGKRWRSKRGKSWADDIALSVYTQLGGIRMDVPGAAIPPEPLIGRVGVWHEVWFPDDKRKRDQDNFTGKHIIDMLTYIKMWGDDSQIVEEHRYWRGKWETGCVWIHIGEI